jgi:hypothetical protein
MQEGTTRMSETGRAGSETVQRASTATAERCGTLAMRRVKQHAAARNGLLARRISWVRMSPATAVEAAAPKGWP